jgi:hypothetical protein
MIAQLGAIRPEIARRGMTPIISAIPYAAIGLVLRAKITF